MSRAVMQKALEDICGAKLCEFNSMSSRHEMVRLMDSAITALRQALAEPEPKPVAWMCPDDPDRATAFAWRYGYCIDCGKPRIPVYTAPTGETK